MMGHTRIQCGALVVVMGMLLQSSLQCGAQDQEEQQWGKKAGGGRERQSVLQAVQEEVRLREAYFETHNEEGDTGAASRGGDTRAERLRMLEEHFQALKQEAVRVHRVEEYVGEKHSRQQQEQEGKTQRSGGWLSRLQALKRDSPWALWTLGLSMAFYLTGMLWLLLENRRKRLVANQRTTPIATASAVAPKRKRGKTKPD